MLFSLILARGWAKENSWRMLLVLSMNLALFCMISNYQPSILLVAMLPMCFNLSTEGKGFPQRWMLGKSLGLWRKAKHFVLYFLGSESVENLRLWILAYSSQVVRMSCNADRDGASARLSSLYPNMPLEYPMTQQPDLFLLRRENSSSQYMQYAMAASTLPWPQPFFTVNLAEYSSFQRIFATWFAYMNMSRLTKTGDMPESSTWG